MALCIKIRTPRPECHFSHSVPCPTIMRPKGYLIQVPAGNLSCWDMGMTVAMGLIRAVIMISTSKTVYPRQSSEAGAILPYQGSKMLIHLPKVTQLVSIPA